MYYVEPFYKEERTIYKKQKETERKIMGQKYIKKKKRKRRREERRVSSMRKRQSLRIKPYEGKINSIDPSISLFFANIVFSAPSPRIEGVQRLMLQFR